MMIVGTIFQEKCLKYLVCVHITHDGIDNLVTAGIQFIVQSILKLFVLDEAAVILVEERESFTQVLIIGHLLDVNCDRYELAVV